MDLPAVVHRVHIDTSRVASPALLALAVAALVVLALALRANGAARHVVFSDEVITLAHVSGWSIAEIAPALDDGREHRLDELAAFTRTRAESGFGSTIRSLANEDAQQPPLYYLVARAWRAAFGDGVATLRALGPILGLVFVFAAALLAREATGTPSAGWYAAALAAVSPVFVLYTQQLGEYTLWTVLIAGTAIALVRASRSHAARWWFVYAIGLALAEWTDTFSLLLPIAFAAIVLRERGSLRAFALATAAAFAAWAPWLVVIISHSKIVAASGAWSAAPMDAMHLFAKVAFNVSTTVFDAEYGDLRWFPFLVLSLAVVVVAFVAAFRAHGRNTVGLALAILTIVPIVAIDLVTGGHRSASTRYLMPAYIGVVLVLASYLASLPRQRAIVAAAVVFFGAFASSLIGTSAPIWWDSYASATTPAIAAVLRTSPALPLISEGPCASLLTLAIAGPPQTPVRCRSSASAAIGAAFVITPSASFRAGAERAGHQVREIVAARAPSGLVGTFRGPGAADDLDTLWVMHR